MAATARCQASIARSACWRTSCRACCSNLVLWRTEHDHRAREGRRPSKSSLTGFVTSLRVNSPSRTYRPPLSRTPFEVNVAVWVLQDPEEIGRLDVRVPLLVVGADGVDRDFGGDRRDAVVADGFATGIEII